MNNALDFDRIKIKSKHSLCIIKLDDDRRAVPSRYLLAPAPDQVFASSYHASDFTDCSPSTKRNDSATLLLPDPLGPTIAVIGAENSSSLFLANDLKPLMVSSFRYISNNSLRPAEYTAYAWLGWRFRIRATRGPTGLRQDNERIVSHTDVTVLYFQLG
jgi:hypothetical protein